jgi:hypothetical protein
MEVSTQRHAPAARKRRCAGDFSQREVLDYLYDSEKFSK